MWSYLPISPAVLTIFISKPATASKPNQLFVSFQVIKYTVFEVL